MTMSDIMFYYMPPKEVTDRLITRFFQGKEPAWRMCPYMQSYHYGRRDGLAAPPPRLSILSRH